MHKRGFVRTKGVLCGEVESGGIIRICGIKKTHGIKQN